MFHLLRLRDVIELEAAYLPRLDKDTAASLKLSTPLANTANNTAAAKGPNNQYRATVKDLLWHRASEKYVNKVIANQGLCVAVNEIEEASSGCVRGNDGSAWSTIEFTVVVFRPHVGQRVSATIANQDEVGITLSISFFAIFVPAHQLVANSRFDKTRKAWFVNVDDDDEASSPSTSPKPEDSITNPDGMITSKPATPQPQQDNTANRNYYKSGEEVLVAIDNVFVRTLSDTGITERLAPMEVVGSFSIADGLGPRSWYE